MDPTELANAILPYLTSLVSAYGVGVVAKIQDQATSTGADATVNLGRQLLLKLIGRSEPAPAIESAMAELAEEPEDQDLQAALRAQVKRVLREDETLRAELLAMLPDTTAPKSTTVTITRSQGFQLGDHNAQTNTFGGSQT